MLSNCSPVKQFGPLLHFSYACKQNVMIYHVKLDKLEHHMKGSETKKV